jgi:hypothetical protein
MVQVWSLHCGAKSQAELAMQSSPSNMALTDIVKPAALWKLLKDGHFHDDEFPTSFLAEV